eukprot:1631344-Amphidinium_carterae.1
MLKLSKGFVSQSFGVLLRATDISFNSWNNVGINVCARLVVILGIQLATASEPLLQHHFAARNATTTSSKQTLQISTTFLLILVHQLSCVWCTVHNPLESP